jgi:hypothetical protein
VRISASSRRVDGLSFRQQLSRESLPFTDPLDLHRRCFNDLLYARHTRGELWISATPKRLSLTSALAKEIGTSESTGQDAETGEDSGKRDDRAEVTGWSHLDLL